MAIDYRNDILKPRYRPHDCFTTTNSVK